MHALRQHHTGKLRLTDVKEMFVQMRDDIYLTRVSLARVLGLRKTLRRLVEIGLKGEEVEPLWLSPMI